MRLLVCGGRGYRDFKRVKEVLERIDFEHCIDVIIHGAATGADETRTDMVRVEGLSRPSLPRRLDQAW